MTENNNVGDMRLVVIPKPPTQPSVGDLCMVNNRVVVYTGSNWIPVSPITPKEFADLMNELRTTYCDDEEALHIEMDKLMMNVLRSLGYSEGVEIFDAADK